MCCYTLRLVTILKAGSALTFLILAAGCNVPAPVVESRPAGRDVLLTLDVSSIDGRVPVNATLESLLRSHELSAEFTAGVAAGDGEAGFVVEYQDGDTDQHFRATREKISLSDVVKAFQSYAAGEGAWKGMFQWAKLDEADLKAKKGCLGAAVMLVAAGGAGVAGLCVLAVTLLRG